VGFLFINAEENNYDSKIEFQLVTKRLIDKTIRSLFFLSPFNGEFLEDLLFYLA